jgi:hypothetical protein
MKNNISKDLTLRLSKFILCFKLIIFWEISLK